MARIAVRKTTKQDRGAARRINKAFTNRDVTRTITQNVRNGASVRSIQRALATSGNKVPQKDIARFIQANYAQGTFTKWLTDAGKKIDVAVFSEEDRLSKNKNGFTVRGFVSGTDMRTNSPMFLTVDVIVPKNTNVVEALQTIRNAGMAMAEDSTEFDPNQTGIVV